MADQDVYTLGEFLHRRLEARGLSGNALSKAAGISEGSVRNLLSHGVDPNAPDPSPHTLRRVAEFLGCQPMVLVNLAYHLDEESPYTALDQYGLDLLRQVPFAQKEQALSILETLAGYEPATFGKALHEVLGEAQERFGKRTFNWQEKIGLRLGELFRALQEKQMPRIVVNVLTHAGCEVDAYQVQHVAEHPLVLAVLGAVVAEKRLTALELLYWFIFPPDPPESYAAMTEEQRQVIQERWDFLVEVAAREMPG